MRSIRILARTAFSNCALEQMVASHVTKGDGHSIAGAGTGRCKHNADGIGAGTDAYPVCGPN
jgi:hypothetical protein